MTDATISTLSANGSYTVELWSNAVTPDLLATYTEVVPVPPVLNTALPTFGFSSVDGMVDLTAYPGGTLTPTWNIPIGLIGDDVNVYVYQQGTNGMNGANQNVQYDITGKAATGTANMVITAPTGGGVWSGGGYWIQGWDTNAGKVFSNYR